MKPAWTSSSGSLPDGFRIRFQRDMFGRLASSLWKSKVAHYRPFGYPWMHGRRLRHSEMLVPGAETVSVDREPRGMAAARMDGGIENGRDLE